MELQKKSKFSCRHVEKQMSGTGNKKMGGEEDKKMKGAGKKNCKMLRKKLIMCRKNVIRLWEKNTRHRKII